MERARCACCGENFPVDLLDTKPNDPANPDACDWEVMECFQCYGSGWLPRNEYQSRYRTTWFADRWADVRGAYRHWYFARLKRKHQARLR